MQVAAQRQKIRLFFSVFTIFILLAVYQIYSQFSLWLETPISTTVSAAFPSEVTLPAVAICNNNQYRLTYITGARLLNRKARSQADPSLNETANVFEKVRPFFVWTTQSGNTRHVSRHFWRRATWTQNLFYTMPLTGKGERRGAAHVREATQNAADLQENDSLVRLA